MGFVKHEVTYNLIFITCDIDGCEVHTSLSTATRAVPPRSGGGTDRAGWTEREHVPSGVDPRGKPRQRHRLGTHLSRPLNVEAARNLSICGRHILTNTLTSTKLQYLLSPWYMLCVSRNNNSQAVLNVEFHRHCETCVNCSLVDTCDFLSVVCVFVQNVSSPRIFYVAGVHECLKTLCFSLVVAAFICLILTCRLPRKRAETHVTHNTKPKLKATQKHMQIELGAVCVGRLSETANSIAHTVCEACRDREHKNLIACKVRGCTSSVIKLSECVLYTNSGSRFLFEHEL